MIKHYNIVILINPFGMRRVCLVVKLGLHLSSWMIAALGKIEKTVVSVLSAMPIRLISRGARPHPEGVLTLQVVELFIFLL